MKQPEICVIGQALVDVTLARRQSPLKMRFGGIAHAARALWALDAAYEVGFIAPSYLTRGALSFFEAHSARRAIPIGAVDGAPNVMLVAHAEEAEPQGYELILRDEQTITLDESSIASMLKNPRTTDLLVFPDESYFSALAPLLSPEQARVYVDADIDYGRFAGESFGGLIDVAILSTSAHSFRETYGGSVEDLRDAILASGAKALLFKENRGGSRFFADGATTSTPAQVRPIVHSVGVGDCFDAAFCVLRHHHDDSIALAYASTIAAEYASTTYPDIFKAATQATLAIPPEVIAELAGVLLPWEDRARISVYVAAPDFDYVDREHIDRLAIALEYHGFRARLPVRENGQLTSSASRAERQRLADADLAVLSECSLLVAVLLFDDPGTLVEIGLAIERGLPVIVYDPFARAENPMVTQLATTVTSSLDGAIAAVFEQAARVR